MSRSQYATLGVIAERERQKSQLREVGIPLYLPLPEVPPAGEDLTEGADDNSTDVFVVWGDDEED